MKFKTSLALAFFIGYFANDVFKTIGSSIASSANASVGGMSYWSLKNDYDFKQAVMSIAEDECRTDVNFNTQKTWFYCGGSSSRHAP